MRILPTTLSGPVAIGPAVHGDERGFFVETFRQGDLAELGIAHEFVQDNHSRSRQGIVRGMHYQPGQAKLVRCARGAILDVVVDIRRGSPSSATGRRMFSTILIIANSTCPTGSPTASACYPTLPTWPTRSPRTTTHRSRVASLTTIAKWAFNGPRTWANCWSPSETATRQRWPSAPTSFRSSMAMLERLHCGLRQ